MKRLLLTLTLLLGFSTPALAAEPTPIYGVPYGTGGDEYGMVLPAPSPSPVTLLYVHGGWWKGQPVNATQAESILLHINEHTGFPIYAIDYPQTCRKLVFECGVREFKAVIRAFHWLQAHAAEYGGNPANIEIVGASAGGQLVERATNRIEAKEPGVLGSVTELSAPGLNFQTFVPELEAGESDSSGVRPTARYLYCASELLANCTQEAEFRESPINELPAECPPQLISWGETNDIVDPAQSIEYANALEANGCEVVRNPARSGHAEITPIENQLIAFWRAH